MNSCGVAPGLCFGEALGSSQGAQSITPVVDHRWGVDKQEKGCTVGKVLISLRKFQEAIASSRALQTTVKATIENKHKEPQGHSGTRW